MDWFERLLLSYMAPSLFIVSSTASLLRSTKILLPVRPECQKCNRDLLSSQQNQEYAIVLSNRNDFSPIVNRLKISNGYALLEEKSCPLERQNKCQWIRSDAAAAMNNAPSILLLLAQQVRSPWIDPLPRSLSFRPARSVTHTERPGAFMIKE